MGCNDVGAPFRAALAFKNIRGGPIYGLLRPSMKKNGQKPRFSWFGDLKVILFKLICIFSSKYLLK